MTDFFAVIGILSIFVLVTIGVCTIIVAFEGLGKDD